MVVMMLSMFLSERCRIGGRLTMTKAHENMKARKGEIKFPVGIHVPGGCWGWMSDIVTPTRSRIPLVPPRV